MKKLLVFSGPTGVGKTSFAIAIAKQLGAEIISTDSRQLYSELNIGVARPTELELKTVPHHFIATHSIHNPLNAGSFAVQARKVLQQIFETKQVAVVAGGSMLYTEALIHGLDNLPSSLDVKRALELRFSNEGITVLANELKELDSEYFNIVDAKNPQRIIRALEVIQITGEKYSTLRTGNKTPLNAEIKHFFLNRERGELYGRINSRVEQMFANGLVDEVNSLKEFSSLNALNTVGYKEIFSHLNGEIELSVAQLQIAQNTRNYAKRQLTWFRNREGVQELNLAHVTPQQFLNQFL
jgi:tRNA dimethylallyltransferase